MRPFTPTSTAAIAVLASVASSSVSADTFPFPTPSFRYEPFSSLATTSQNIAEEKLGYVEVTWNNHGLAPIEHTGWAGLSSNERDGASLLGYTQDTWDCFIHHYEGYTWDDLAEKGVQTHFIDLGWTQAHWEHTVDTTVSTDARWWGQLTDNEKRAANGICYFKDNWDKIDMNPNPSFFPHPVPNFRYRPWDELDAVTQNVAANMMNYTEDKWDSLGTSVTEKNTFLNLRSEQRAGALDLGFYTHTWDCFMNHYLAYFWSSFHDDLLVAIETLGWNEAMWMGKVNLVPPSENKIWIDLTPEEKAAATRLCYFKEIWDQEPIPRWYDYEAGMNTVVTTGGPVPKDIDLDIFVTTGYAGKAPGDVGTVVYTATDAEVEEEKSSSSYRLVSLSVLALVLPMGAFLFV
mmetsp:Transcript_26034/g.42290  ORF Transcript_26034/g.42290 Transcript_26034/m.42290 type:complete len:404 (-) Transcript_26034:184-1395(-)|eukprot:CAMPEP_0196141576 /NCGR_PEP_ID=MMETSP0910-20130528/9966_1 /TAXON_ID=49265 /ORGANISM="Thalassiosira rotula, Strain GSO102" /LENGTH=403 /DNA_ID=CAMNT_0041402743 /DNA_START=25 /DNA_END=1236 /DNA_ORIENTATION=-